MLPPRPETSAVASIELIEKALQLLGMAEAASYQLAECEPRYKSKPEFGLIEELLHVATHETSSSLGFLVQDIRRLLARMAVREKYALFGEAQFDAIVARGWSIALVDELRQQYPDCPLAELSALVKGLHTEWGALPKIQHSSIKGA